jgi:hypothetical protein
MGIEHQRFLENQVQGLKELITPLRTWETAYLLNVKVVEMKNNIALMAFQP